MNADAWAAIVASSLGWEEAHLSLESAVRDLPAALRGTRAPAIERSIWEILEHIRIAQRDLLDFCRDADYQHDLRWPEEYWPAHPAPVDADAWEHSLSEVGRDRAALAAFARENAANLHDPIPHGTGQTYLRTLLVALDHASYHTAQIVAVRRLIGAWPPPEG